jgi:hypothetical protein
MQKPTLFIASSVEGLSVADAVNANLDHDIQCTLWRNGTFKLGSGSLTDLITKSSAVDFAVFVFTPDDLTTIRNKEVATARDNVVFELGLFIGAIGMDRCYIVKPRGVDMHLPSDLLGITTADYAADRSDNDIASALNAACTKIKARVAELGPLRRVPFVAPGATDKRVANPPDYKLQPIDLQFLAQCVQSHVSAPYGRPYNWIENQIKGEPDYKVSLSAVKLMRLGYIEKSVETNSNQDDEYFAYRATEDGLDVFVKHESEYAALYIQPSRGYGSAPRSAPRPAPPPNSKSGFDDMDDDIPF